MDKEDNRDLTTEGRRWGLFLSGFSRFQFYFWSCFFFVYWGVAGGFLGDYLLSFKLGSVR